MEPHGMGIRRFPSPHHPLPWQSLWGLQALTPAPLQVQHELGSARLRVRAGRLSWVHLHRVARRL